MDMSAGERDPVKGADWLEARAVYSVQGVVHKNELASEVLAAGVMDDEQDRADHDIDDIEDDRTGPGVRLTDNTTVEIERRVDLCGDAYPFRFDNGQLRWVKRGTWADPYIVCLLASDRDLYAAGDDTSNIFEHLTTLAVKSMLDGCSVRFGYPRDTMPKPIKEAIRELARLTAAKQTTGWDIENTDRDLGVDVVGWKPFRDDYNNMLQLYVQCATGEGWVEDKMAEPNLELWSGILQWGLRPVRALAIPYVVNENRLWERRLAGRLLLDRTRIASTLYGRELEGGIVEWGEWAENRATLGRTWSP